jgi:hypothetical protein
MAQLIRFGIVSLACALAISACGGEDNGRPSLTRDTDVPAVNQCAQDDGLEFRSLLPFELSGGFDPTRATCGEGVGCSFYFNYDLTQSAGTEAPLPRCPDATTDPPTPTCPEGALTETSVAVMGTPAVSELPEARCGEAGHAWHFTAKDLATCLRHETFKIGWGGALDVTFTPDVLNAADWHGISLWARRGQGASGQALILSVVDQFTSGVTCASSDPALQCDPTAIPDSSKCDPFGVVITLRDEWTFFAIEFDDMRQKGFGKPSPNETLDTSGIIRMQFLMAAGDWDFWIDDVSLFRRPQ